MKQEEYRKARAWYFEIRNHLKLKPSYYYYYDAIQLNQRYEETYDPCIKELIDYFLERKGNPSDLWYIGQNTWLNHDYQLD